MTLSQMALSQVTIYQISYVGQTVRHFSTRFNEHHRESQPLGKHLKTCLGGSSSYSWKNIDTAGDQVTLQTLEALHIDRRKPALNTRDEYRQRPLTIRI